MTASTKDARAKAEFKTILICPVCRYGGGIPEPPDVYEVLTCDHCRSDFLVLAVYLTRDSIGLSLFALSQTEANSLRNARDYR